ncbi:acyl-CoA synthetase (AMP-forming)/AMP-acid ligase II [Sediminihabitans luteus]|uniref:Acyl-CoA synthetase (AMP-forming)/AMP-acid ligase II n=1 Tax=Sediminihabitans luteus TaxID=1138585 RepID=A0A2M9CZT4_9CELL|nr:AMP-binding protein [Sediminihabitans luteus]PJJ77363.1 acyl-CoA synthetase (AMP-forming)/AMP-acid ligase II [Sediminihabitans luteus]GII98256.1 long-chain-fatty-acid--CoA ligase [Sediminihabitans luteus]
MDATLVPGIPVARIPDARRDADPTGACIADAGTTLDNAGFARAVDAAAAHLATLGVAHGGTVAVMMPNRVELVVTMFAAWRLGAACTPLNPALTADEAHYQITDARAVVVVADEPSTARLGDAPVPVVPADELGTVAGDVPAPSAADDDTALLIYTSGTTGRPKGVVLDHANVAAMGRMVIDWFALTAEDRSLLIMPLFHINGIVVSVVAPLLAGGTSYVAPRFDPTAFWSLVEREGATYTSGVPTIYAMLLALPDAPSSSTLRFAVCGAAPMPPGLIERFGARYGVPVVEGYGLSETTAACTANPLDGERRDGTVGFALPGCRIRVVDADGAALPVGEAGEIQVQGPNVMRGYLGRPEDTAAALRDGWLATGDVGVLDEDGYLRLVDRVKDMIIRGGENIYPMEIENVLHQHDAVQEVAVVGRPDDMYGEQPVAVVVLAPGHELTLEDVAEFCSQRLARYKVPRGLLVVDALPRNGVGKVVKGDLRALVREGASV